ncbi:MAG: phenylalanine--tRNA ligase subunit alpha [Lactobacillales bacterium]|jgi:phenylalanyl-tRNA synthetase alpha chain|nr:phenylalanine--tRNA ligase subunit alpha [Lactobacillales bacterium]
MSVFENLETLKSEALLQINAASDLSTLNDKRVEYLGKKGPITDVMKQMKDLSNEDKPKLGAAVNIVKSAIEDAIEAKKVELEAAEIGAKLAKETIDVTLPATKRTKGSRHILTQTREEIEDIFIGMGYSVENGYEIESDNYNFERMNLPKNHPARDMQDTFYITPETLFRTHTSPVQARVMEKHDFTKGALKMIAPGKVYRRDTDDATHSHQFMQIEGLVIDKGIAMSDLKGTLDHLIKKMFGAEREIRLRPSFFPFTEPSVEVDISCFACGGEGCRVCKHTGWIEILGGGMVHPKVLEMSGIDPETYTGFAFGIGVERVAMLRFGINDIRGFYQNDVRFTNQFK